ncbi:MAG: sec-independent protein translocase protein TatC [Baekduia sp.]|jgi:sec-independent protein translocase protein TatC|nr:sec-independent protein translocase protein TatC [Baekduia sp.]
MARLKPISHDDQLALVDHLDELRFRVVVALAAFGTALALCFWQNHRLLEIVNAPLNGKQPITLGVAEAFSTTLTISAYAAIALSLPVILWQLYAFVLPAFAPNERKVAKPMMLLIPFLFIAGALFGYYVVVPSALHFLLNFNASEFNLQIRAKEYYGFFAQTVIACGIVFQVPVGVLAATRLGIVSPEKLRKHRRHAIVGAAVIAMLLPGVDPVSMLIETVPLIVLYELSIILASVFGGKPAPDLADGAAGA